MGHLQQHAGTVPGVGFAAAGTAVIEVAQDRNGLLQDLVRLAALYVDNEADPAGIVLELRIVQALFARPHVRCTLVLCRHLLSTGAWPRRSPACLAHVFPPKSTQRRAALVCAARSLGGRFGLVHAA
jgi:hypothetical protein